MKQIGSMGFYELIEVCGGQSREEQLRYLVKVVMQLMINHLGRDAKLPDANVLHALVAKGLVTEIFEKDVSAAMKVLDSLYEQIACAFIDDPDFNPSNLRSEAIEFMQESMRDRSVVK